MHMHADDLDADWLIVSEDLPYVPNKVETRQRSTLLEGAFSLPKSGCYSGGFFI
jgi:hypothetical protein